jgi:hypothetical protein
MSLHEDGMIICEKFPSGRIWINNKEVDLKEMKVVESREAYMRFCFDPISKKTWAWNRQTMEINKYFFITDITNGFYDKNDEIVFSIPGKGQPVNIFVYDETALVVYGLDRKLYGLIDFQTGGQEIIDLSDIPYNFDSNIWVIGYDGRSIIYNQGYYDILESVYYRHSIKLNDPRLQADKHKIITIDKKNNGLMYYDLYTGHYTNQKIKRNKFNLKNSYDVYVEDGIIYIATASILSNFNFLSQPSQRNWYRYDINTEKKTKVSAPTIYAELLGRTRKDSSYQNSLVVP